MKILITGAAGFIGHHTASKMLSKGHKIIGIDNLNDYYSVNLKTSRLEQLGINLAGASYNQHIVSSSQPNYTFIKLDIEDRESLQTIFKSEKFDAENGNYNPFVSGNWNYKTLKNKLTKKVYIDFNPFIIILPEFGGSIW